MFAKKLNALARAAAERPLDERPACAYGAVTRARLQDLAEVVGRIETKINAILGGVIVAVLVEAIRSLRP